MPAYEVKFADGSTVSMSGRDGEDACRRAADLHQRTAVAWRTPRVGIYVGGPTS